MNQTNNKTKQAKPLTASDLVINQKYVPFQKTAGYMNRKGEDELASSAVWRSAKKEGTDYLYFTGTSESGAVYCFDYKPRLMGEEVTGDIFNPQDVTPYIDIEEEEDAIVDEITVTECTYTPRPSGIHEQIVAKLNLQVGDLVEVTHSVPSYNLGWDNSWTESMAAAIGKRFKVTSIDSQMGIELDGADGFSYPAQCLRVVKRKATEPVIVELNDELAAVVEDGVISVYGQPISFEAVRRLYEAVESYKASGPCE
jgi:hypothetical protein